MSETDVQNRLNKVINHKFNAVKHVCFCRTEDNSSCILLYLNDKPVNNYISEDDHYPYILIIGDDICGEAIIRFAKRTNGYYLALKWVQPLLSIITGDKLYKSEYTDIVNYLYNNINNTEKLYTRNSFAFGKIFSKNLQFHSLQQIQ